MSTARMPPLLSSHLCPHVLQSTPSVAARLFSTTTPHHHLPYTLPRRQPTSLQTFKPSSVRHASTARRHRKLLNVPPLPALPRAPTGSSARSRIFADFPRGQDSFGGSDHVVFDPPSSAPNVYHTPAKFLPPGDARRAAFARPLPASVRGPRTGIEPAQQASSALRTSEAGAGHVPGPLPPPVHEPYEKQYHVTPAQMEEMRALRREDEGTWTRSKLAERFGCSKLFVGMVVQASEGRVRALEKVMAARRSSWGPKKRGAREERGRRREAWARDE